MLKKSIFLLCLLLSLFISFNSAAQENFTGLPEVTGQFKEYTAKQGEDLYLISKKYGLAIEHVMYANGMNDIKTHVGQKLLIPTRRILPPVQVSSGIVLNLPERGMFFFKDGKFDKFYPVAIGAPGKFMTPTGDMKVVNMAVNPTWLPPEWAKEEDPVPAGPDNPLGDRWIGLNEPGLGIHATNRPVSVGLAVSHGCLRMYPEMAHELYEKVYIDMPVKIIYEPVILGFDPAQGKIYMAVYPDVYKKTPGLLPQAKIKLAENNMLDFADEAKLKKITDEKKGIPELIIGSDIVIKVNDKKQDLWLSPISNNGKIWVSGDLLKALGANITFNESNTIMSIQRGKRKISLKIKKTSEFDDKKKESTAKAYLWQGRAIIPLSYVLKGIGVSFKWLPEHRTLLIYVSRRLPAAGKKHPGGSIKKTAIKPVRIVSSPSPTPFLPFAPIPTPSSEVPTEPTPLPSELPDEV